MRAPLRLSLSRRIQLALGAVLLSAIVVAILLLMSVQSLARLSEEGGRVTRAAQAAYELEIEALQGMLSLRRYVDSRDAQTLVDMEAYRSAAAGSRADLRALTRLPEISGALDRYEALMPQRIAAANAILAKVGEGRSAEELSTSLHQRERLDAELRELLRSIIEIEQQELQRILDAETEARERFLYEVLLTLVLAMLVVGGLLYALAVGGVTRRLKQLTDMAHQIAAGDFSQRQFADEDDEVAMLAGTFNEMAGQLATFDKVKEEFVALASHQLRTPATAVKGNLGMLLEGFCGELTAEQREVLNDANESNQRQLAVIDDMLWVARTDAGRLVLSREPADLARLAADVVSEQMSVAEQRQQVLSLDRPAQPVVALVDPQKIRMVFENLVSNASKYTPEGGSVRVRLVPRGTKVVLTVADTGVGIADEDIPRLFAKFSRIANPLSDRVGGTGLGLYLAREIVRLHGGAVDVDSRPGAGTTFTVTLPVGSADDDQNTRS